MIGNPSTAMNKSASATGRDLPRSASLFATNASQPVRAPPDDKPRTAFLCVRDFGVRPLKVPVFAAENRELAPAVYLTNDANFGSWIAPLSLYWPTKGNHLRSSRRRSCRWEWSESNEQHPEKRNKRSPGCSQRSAALFLNAQAAIAQQSSPPISSEKIAQIVTSSDRTVADRANDVRRKPEQTLGFIGIHSPHRRGRSQPGRCNVANEALLTIVAAASIHSHSRGDHYEG